MRASLKALSCLAVATAACVAPADTVLRQKTLADLSKASSTSYFKRNNCDFVSVSTDSSGGPVATLKFRGTYASFGQDLTSSQDWSAYNMVQAVIANKESYPVHFKFIVQLGSDPNNYTNAYTGSFYLEKYESRKFIFNLNPDDPEPYDMEYLRPVLSDEYTEVIAGSNFRNLKTIYHWRISNQNSSTPRLAISQIKLLKQNLVFDDITDAWGQYTDRWWTSKIDADSDFSSRKAAELTDLSANPGPGETYGTSKLTNPSKTLGIWKTVRNSSGMMYLQHPDGKLFWSMGVSGVGEGAATPTEYRQNYFKYLPSKTGTYASAYIDRPTPDGTQTCFSFSQKNLMTKYGTNYLSSWKSMVKSRLRSWGINTLGIQCKDDFLDGSIPYTVILDTDEFSTRLRTPNQMWGSMPDPYTSGFQTWMTAKFTTELAPEILRENFMGVFVDNELSWGNTKSTNEYYNVARGVLNSASTQPAKTAFMNQLKTKYKNSISSLNTAWGSKYSSWSSFLSTKWLPSSFTTAMKSDMGTFTYELADEYFYKVNAALTAANVKSLYLGCRFAHFVPEVVNAASKHVDVLSFNMYRTWDNVDWEYYDSLSKPVLISEMGYGMKARGTFGGPATAFSVQERADYHADFLDEALSHKNIVGVHWYCYVDQPITGRWSDYENTGMGLVDVADNPYQETVDVLRNFTKSMYTNRG